MTAVEVDRLSLRCDIGRREPVRFAIEDALRTELPGDGRLVLLRKLQVGPAGSSAYPAWRQTAMREAWMAATGSSRHGSEDGAADANCVWFASQAEAERLLLERLLRGRAAEGWFWKLALPRWRGRPAPEWLPELLAEAAVPEEEARFLALAEICMGVGAEQAFVAALERVAPLREPASAPAGLVASEPARDIRDSVTRSPRAASERLAEGATAAHSVQMRALLQRLMSMPRTMPAARAIVRAQILRHSPAASLSPATLERAIGNALDLLIDPPLRPRGERPADSRRETGWTRQDAVRSSAPPLSGPKPSEAAPEAPPRQRLHRDEKARAAVEAVIPEVGRAAVEPPLRLPLHSRHAGLWLVVPALGDMGLRDWLTRHPHLLGDNPGARLLLAIARHHRVPADDPALAPFGEVAVRPPAPEWMRLWRHGLDRWLRRHARRRLHDLVNRPGRIDRSDQRLDAIYPPGDADIRLRRLALDRDPGWTDWLGLSIRYHFRGLDER